MLDVGELDRACRAALAGYKCPKAYEIVDELPRNAMGKIDKKMLRARYR
jgi:long-chain acyl-CoA synthetase